MLILGIFVLVGFFLLEIDHRTKKYKVIILVVLGLLLYFSAINIFSSNKVELSSPKGVVSAVYYYFGWMGETSVKLWDIGENTVNLVGDAIKTNNSVSNFGNDRGSQA